MVRNTCTLSTHKNPNPKSFTPVVAACTAQLLTGFPKEESANGQGENKNFPGQSFSKY